MYFILSHAESFPRRDIGLQVKDFGPSWRDGIAFLAIVDAIKKGLIDLAALRRATNRDRLETAFSVAERELGIHRLLDPEVSTLEWRKNGDDLKRECDTDFTSSPSLLETVFNPIYGLFW